MRIACVLRALQGHVLMCACVFAWADIGGMSSVHTEQSGGGGYGQEQTKERKEVRGKGGGE